MKNLNGKKVTADQMLGDLRTWVEGGGKLADRELELLKLLEHLSMRCRMLSHGLDKAHRRLYELASPDTPPSRLRAMLAADCAKAGEPGAHSG